VFVRFSLKNYPCDDVNEFFVAVARAW